MIRGIARGIPQSFLVGRAYKSALSFRGRPLNARRFSRQGEGTGAGTETRIHPSPMRLEKDFIDPSVYPCIVMRCAALLLSAFAEDLSKKALTMDPAVHRGTVFCDDEQDNR